MQTANFQTVIETIFFIVLFYYIFKFVMRLLLPVAIKKVVEQAEETLRNQSQQNHYNTRETTQTAPKNKMPHETKKVGEYVDFEEIE